MGFIVSWILDPSARGVVHTLTVTAELDYYELTWNGNVGVHHHLITSVNLSVTPDSPTYANNDSFDNATQIQEGQYSWQYLDSLFDIEDFYKIHIDAYRSVRAHLDVDNTGKNCKDFNLYLYNSSRKVVWSSENGVGLSEEVYGKQLVTSDDWYVEANVTPAGQYGFYNLTVQTAFMCDINYDGSVNILDAISLSGAYGTNVSQSRFKPDADLNWDGAINILDAITLANNYGHSEQMRGASVPSGGGSAPTASSGKGLLTMGGVTSVFVDPSQIAVYGGESFNMNVKVADVSDLSGWEFKLYWNSTVLNCTNAAVVTPTIWQGNTQDCGPGLEANYNSTSGRFWKAEAANYPAPSFNGSMTIATLTFQALQPGTTSLTLADTILGNSTAQPITCGVSSGSVTVYCGRYMRSDIQTVNGLNAYKLNIPESTSYTYKTQSGSGYGASWGIRAWVRHSNGTEQEISLDAQTGTPKAVVSRGSGSGVQSGTVTVAQTGLQLTDSLVVRVYVQVGESDWTLCATFTTEQLQTTTLQAATWTVYYYTYAAWNRYTQMTTAKFYWGTTTYYSRIQNLPYG
jgi:hypothetical protein